MNASREKILQERFTEVLFPEHERQWYERRFRKPLFGYSGSRRIKRLFDLALCIFVVPLALPVFIGCAIAVKIDSKGPILFVQHRTGHGGRRFKMYKFRTMVKDAEKLKHQLMHLNTLAYPDFKILKDPRITRVGKFLRKSSLDELPQILNVLQGHMSFVGPRPTSFGADKYHLWHTERLEGKPGITGLWQVSGRNNLEFDERLRLDIAYLRNQSLWLDLRILFRTFGAVFRAQGH